MSIFKQYRLDQIFRNYLNAGKQEKKLTKVQLDMTIYDLVNSPDITYSQPAIIRAISLYLDMDENTIIQIVNNQLHFNTTRD